ncbi:nitroreductase family protein [Candidatus Bathyarchaeota archaeon]|nr:nitroreductase family protein [Candidatus Bathyarchaeota archaeon]
MEFMDVVQKRRSIRKYRSEKILNGKLTNILEAARIAPSGLNRQSWKFIVVRDKENKAKLAEACNEQLWIDEADAIIVGCWLPIPGIDDMRLRRDVTIAMEHIALAAVNEGLGSCWIGAFDMEAVKSLLNIPEDVGINAIMPIGYPAEPARQRTFKKLGEIVCYESFK